MAISIFLVALYATVFFVAALTVAKAYRFRHLLAHRMIMLFVLAHAWIALCALIIFSFDSLALKESFSRLRFLGLSLIGPCLAVFVNSIFRKWKWVGTRWGLVVLFLPAAVTWILTLSPWHQDLMVRDFVPIEVEGLSVVRFRPGPWLTWHMLASYACSGLMLLIAALSFRGARGARRRQIALIWAGCFAPSIVDIYCFVTHSPWRWAMLSGATFVLGDIALVYAAFRYQLLDVVPYATERVFRSVADPILVVGREGFVEAANDAALELFDFPRERLGAGLSVVLPPELESGGDFERQGRHFDVVRERISDGGGVQAKIIYLREITARKKIEESLSEHLEFKSKMLSLIAHDVVGNIQAQTTLVSAIQGQASGESREAIETFVDSHVSLHDVLRNILNWERSQNLEFRPAKAPFDARIFAQSCAESVELQVRLRSLHLELDVDLGGVSMLEADSGMLSTIVRNILSNAVRASHSGGRIRLSVAHRNGSLKVEVEDHGKGMSAEQVRKLMESSQKFFGGGVASVGGFGIGLFISRYFVRLHGGEFWVESTEGSGTRVGFSVPV